MIPGGLSNQQGGNASLYPIEHHTECDTGSPEIERCRPVVYTHPLPHHRARLVCVVYSYWERVGIMAASQQVESLITALEQSVEAGLSYFQSTQGQSHVKIGRWGARELLCHLVWWHQATAEGMEAVASGGTPYRIYASVDEMNARAVGRLSGKTVDQLAELTRQWHARLVKAARGCADLNATVLVFGDGSGRSVQQRLEAMAHHWSEHLKELKALSAA